MQEYEACEQDQESTDPAFPLVVVRPGRPVLIRRRVVRRVATAEEPGENEEHRERDAGQGQQPLPGRGERVGSRGQAETFVYAASAAESALLGAARIGASFRNPQTAA